LKYKFNHKEVFPLIDQYRLEGKTWQEIADTLNYRLGEAFSESAYRKPFQAWKDGKEDGITDIELARQLQNVEIQKKAVRLQRTINTEQIRDLAIHKVFSDEVADYVRGLSALNPRYFPRPIIKGRQNTPKKSKDLEYFFFLSDLHYDGDEDDLRGRLTKVRDTIVEYVLENDIEHVNIVEVGDTIEGASLRTSQLMGIKKGMIPQILDVAEAYSNLLHEVSLRVGSVDFFTVTSSNHTQLRQLSTKRNELVEEDLMQVFHRFIEARVAHLDNVEVVGEKELLINVGGNYNIYVAHGHSGKLNPSTLDTYVTKLSFFNDNLADYFIFGHFHHYRQVSLNSKTNLQRKAFLLASMSSGGGTYEEDLLLSSKPAITVMCFHKDHGHYWTVEEWL
jgi:hypothetical protein